MQLLLLLLLLWSRRAHRQWWFVDRASPSHPRRSYSTRESPKAYDDARGEMTRGAQEAERNSASCKCKEPLGTTVAPVLPLPCNILEVMAGVCERRAIPHGAVSNIHDTCLLYRPPSSLQPAAADLAYSERSLSAALWEKKASRQLQVERLVTAGHYYDGSVRAE